MKLGRPFLTAVAVGAILGIFVGVLLRRCKIRKGKDSPVKHDFKWTVKRPHSVG